MPAIPQPNDDTPPRRRSTDQPKVRADEVFTSPVPADDRERMVREASEGWVEYDERLTRIRNKRGS